MRLRLHTKAAVPMEFGAKTALRLDEKRMDRIEKTSLFQGAN